MLFKIVLFAFSILLPVSLVFDFTEVEEKDGLTYIVGISETIPQNPVIVDLNREKIFYSKISFPQVPRHEIFYDIDSQSFIITRIKASQYVEIFVVDVNPTTSLMSHR